MQIMYSCCVHNLSETEAAFNVLNMFILNYFEHLFTHSYSPSNDIDCSKVTM